jgi:hypothetical protein
MGLLKYFRGKSTPIESPAESYADPETLAWNQFCLEQVRSMRQGPSISEAEAAAERRESLRWNVFCLEQAWKPGNGLIA